MHLLGLFIWLPWKQSGLSKFSTYWFLWLRCSSIHFGNERSIWVGWISFRFVTPLASLWVNAKCVVRHTLVAQRCWSTGRVRKDKEILSPTFLPFPGLFTVEVQEKEKALLLCKHCSALVKILMSFQHWFSHTSKPHSTNTSCCEEN